MRQESRAMYESGKPKRKRKPQQSDASRQTRLYIAISIAMFITLMAGIGALVYMTISVPEIPELTATYGPAINPQIEILKSGTEWAATAYPTRNIPTDNWPCTWHTTTRADPNGLTLDVQQKLDQALLPADVRAMVYLTGDECLREGDLETPDFFPRRTDFYLLVKTDDRYLNANIESDDSTRAQLGFLVRQILNVLEENFPADKTEGSEPGIITFTFMNGDVVRSASLSQNELSISHYNDYEVGTAVIAAIGNLQQP
jgi:hypothetical protein